MTETQIGNKSRCYVGERMKKWSRLLLVLMLFVGAPAGIYLYSSTYRQVKDEVVAIASIQQRALSLDGSLQTLCLGQNSVMRCRDVLRQLKNLVIEPDVSPSVTRLVWSWEDLLDLRQCQDPEAKQETQKVITRRCQLREVRSSGIGYLNYDPAIYSNNPQSLEEHILGQLEMARNELRKQLGDKGRVLGG